MKRHNWHYLIIRYGEDTYIYKYEKGNEEQFYRLILKHGMDISLNLQMSDTLQLIRHLEKMIKAGKTGTIKMLDGKVSFQEGEF